MVMAFSYSTRRLLHGLLPVLPQPRLADRLIDVFRRRHYGCHTDQAHVGWIKPSLNLQHGRHLSPPSLAQSSDPEAGAVAAVPVDATKYATSHTFRHS